MRLLCPHISECPQAYLTSYVKSRQTKSDHGVVIAECGPGGVHQILLMLPAAVESELRQAEIIRRISLAITCAFVASEDDDLATVLLPAILDENVIATEFGEDLMDCIQLSLYGESFARDSYWAVMLTYSTTTPATVGLQSRRDALRCIREPGVIVTESISQSVGRLSRHIYIVPSPAASTYIPGYLFIGTLRSRVPISRRPVRQSPPAVLPLYRSPQLLIEWHPSTLAQIIRD